MPRTNRAAAAKKAEPKQVKVSEKKAPKAKAAARRAPAPSERLKGSLVPGVLPPTEVTPPEPKKVRGVGATKSFKQIEVTPEQVESFGFQVSIDPSLFQKVKKSSGKVPLPVGFDGRVFSAIDRYNPRKGGVSSFVNQACARWLRDNLDQVLLATLDANTKSSGSVRNAMVSLDPDIAMKLKAAVTLLKEKGFAKCTIQGLILGCCLLQAKDLKLV